MQLQHAWFVIERSESIQSKPLGRYILGEPIVLVRGRTAMFLHWRIAARTKEFHFRKDVSDPAG